MKYFLTALFSLTIACNALIIKGIETGTTYADVTRFQAPGVYEPNEAALVDAGLLAGVGLREHGGAIQRNLVTYLGNGWFITARHTRPIAGQVYIFGDRRLTPKVDTVKYPPQMTWKEPHPQGFIQTLSNSPDICVFRVNESTEGLKAYQVGDPLKVNDDILVHGFVNYGGLNWATGPNSIRRVQGGKFDFADLANWITITGDSGGPTFVRDGDSLRIVGIHQGSGQDVDLTDSQVKAWIVSIIGKVEAPPVEEKVEKPGPEPVQTITLKAGQKILIIAE